MHIFLSTLAFLVLFLDEPTSGLPVNQALVVVTAMRAFVESGIGIGTYVLHNPTPNQTTFLVALLGSDVAIAILPTFLFELHT